MQYLTNGNDDFFLLKKAMAYLISRYPKASNGLSYWDEIMLTYSETHAPKAVKIIAYTLGYVIHGKNSVDMVSDDYLFSRLKNMASPNLKKPLLEVNDFNLPMRETEIKILPNGIKALNEEIDVIKENGIDEWVGGVHLDSSSGGVWVRDRTGIVWKSLSS